MSELQGNREERKPLLSSSRTSTAEQDSRMSRISVNAIRFLMLCLQYYIIGALYFCIDIPSGIETTIIKVTDMNVMQYNALFSAYTWPDVLMPVIGGMIVDRIVGIRSGFIIFTSILMIGQGVQAFGGYLGKFWIMLLGRIIFGSGVGTVSSLIAGSQILLFNTNYATVFIAITTTFLRLGAGISLLVSQRIYNSFSFLPNSSNKLSATLGVGFLLMVGSVLSAIVIILLDRKIKKLDSSGQKKLSRAKPSFTSFFNFSVSYWLTVLIGAFFFPVIFSFVANGQLFFVSKFGINVNEAGLLNSLNYAATVLLSPFLGMLISYCKYHSVWMMSGALLAISSHVIFTSSKPSISGSNPFVYSAAVLLSLGYSFVICAQWPLVGQIAKPNQLTTAFGISIATYNLFYSLLAIAQGRIIDNFGFFIYEIINLQSLWIVGLLIVLLWTEKISLKYKLRISAVAGTAGTAGTASS